MQLQRTPLVKTETLYLFMLCPAHVSAREHTLVLTMAPRIRNKKKTKRITSPLQTGDDSGRPPGPATTIAGSSLAPMPAPNQCRHSPRYHNDDGATNIARNPDARQVDHHPPRFEVIESDDESEAQTTSIEEAESEEMPPADEATPTTSRQPIAASSPTAPTVSTISVNDEFFKKLSENILLGVNAV